MTEIVTMKLGPRRELGWVEDLPEGGTRHLVGWDPKMEGDFEEIWRSGNSWWRLEPGRAVRCDLDSRQRGGVRRQDQRHHQTR